MVSRSRACRGLRKFFVDRFALKDETGKVRAHWQVERRSPTLNGNARWLCRCMVCGLEKVIEGILLRSKPPACKGCRAGR